jgi:phosphoglycerol transferase MdoB-like AlkP superfamily enzyme
VAKWLGLETGSPLEYWRISEGRDTRRSPNFVVIIMESLGSPRTSVFSGPDVAVEHDPTPNLRGLLKESLYFSAFFAPTRTTSRAIFTTITGIPDINRSAGTSSRNPSLVDQFSVLGEFRGYDISYMIGGSASWANIRGILTYNIPGLKLLEEGHWKALNVDVWGISDLDLFREAVEYLNSAPAPFITVVQTAGFHRPWTIPEDNAGFGAVPVPDATVRYYGFENAEEYTSLRFSDHALGEFFRMARQQPWFENTVFAIMGDHGLNGSSENVNASYLGCRLEGYHTPLLLYAPGRPDLITPGEETFPAGQPDIFPTLAAMAGIPFRNHGLGRNLLDPHTRANAAQFIAGNNEDFIRLVKDGYCYFREEQESLFRLDDPSGANHLADDPERAAAMRLFAEDIFATAKYLLYNNKKNSAPALP